MQAVSNLPISAWRLLADLNGGKTAARCRAACILKYSAAHVLIFYWITSSSQVNLV